ncbi:hypothetical protein D3C84_454470 [compost metagenome]
MLPYFFKFKGAQRPFSEIGGQPSADRGVGFNPVNEVCAIVSSHIPPNALSALLLYPFLLFRPRSGSHENEGRLGRDQVLRFRCTLFVILIGLAGDIRALGTDFPAT